MMKKHSKLIKCSIGVITSALQVMPTYAAEKAERPNILFVPVDDLKPLLGCYGNSNIKSPNIDRLAKEGILFFNAQCQQAVCGPSRASLMTGLYPDSTKVWDLKTRMRDVNPDILTLPQYFRENGYTTVGMGKTYDPRCVGPELDKESWSIPYVKPSDDDYDKKSGPPETWYQNPETKKNLKEARSIIKAKHLKGKAAFAVLKQFNARPVTECVDVADNAYIDGVSANQACEYLAKFAKSGEPFFLSVGFKKPHLPFTAPKKYWDLYSDDDIKLALFQKHAKNSEDFTYQDCWELRYSYTDFPTKGPAPEELQKRMVHGYMASVSYIDAQVGKVLNKLKELGLDKNTIICLWGDHGWHLGDHGMWGKHTNLEQATRAPLIFAGKGIPASGMNFSPVEFVDIFPTLCDLAGLDVPKQLQGRSLVSALGDSEGFVREVALSQFPRSYKGAPVMGYALRGYRYRYIEWIQKDFRNGETSGPVVFAELYDYKTDPLETVNQADNPEYRDVVQKMSEILRNNYKVDVNDQKKDKINLKE